MVKSIQHIANFYLYSSLHIGLCSGFLYLFSIQRFSIDLDKNYLIFVVSSTIFTYSIHRIIGMKKVKKFAHKGRFAVIEQFKTHIILYAFICLLTCTYTLLNFSWHRILLVAGAGVISMLYTLPVFGRSKRLRDISHIKIFLIAIVWAYVTETIPLIESGYSPIIILLLFMERMAFFIAITIPFDIRDYTVDKANNVSTIPSVIGKRKAIQLSILLLAIASLIEIYLLNAHPSQMSSALALIITYLISGIMIFTFRKKKNDYYYSGLIDATIMLPFIFQYFLL